MGYDNVDHVRIGKDIELNITTSEERASPGGSVVGCQLLVVVSP